MRKLKLQVQISVDGFIAGPSGDMEWMVMDWDEELKHYIRKITEPVDCIILGRKLAEGFIPYWASHPNEEGAGKINGTKKIVFTKSLDTSPWHNTILATGDLMEEITKLKKEAGGDIIVYGGADFVSALISKDLIDDYYLLLNPSAIGKGMPIFQRLNTIQKLKLVQSKSFACGIVLLHYTNL
jgi:dihydrofolate reductase